MKKAVLLLGLLISFQSFAKEGDTLLKCNLPLSGMDSVEVIEDSLTASMIVIVRWDDGSTDYRRDDLVNYSSGKITLAPDWHGYELTLHKEAKGSWSLESRDECSGSYSSMKCIESSAQ